MRKFFEVDAKCGHVGRGYYYEGVFYEIASDASYAAKIVRGRGRVKYDHKDAILSVREISQEEFELGLKAKENNPYFSCSNKRERDAVWEQVCFGIRCEKGYNDLEEDYIESRKTRVQHKLKKQKQNVRSYEKLYDDKQILTYCSGNDISAKELFRDIYSEDNEMVEFLHNFSFTEQEDEWYSLAKNIVWENDGN